MPGVLVACGRWRWWLRLRGARLKTFHPNHRVEVIPFESGYALIMIEKRKGNR